MSVDRVAVIGVGNPDCGDDGAGPRVAHLVGTAIQDKRLKVTVAPLEPARLLAEVEGCDAAIIVDACVLDEEPGQVHVFTKPDFPRSSQDSSHGFGLAEALSLGSALGVLPKSIRIVAISGAHFGVGEPMSRPVRLGTIHAAWCVVREVSGWLND